MKKQEIASKRKNNIIAEKSLSLLKNYEIDKSLNAIYAGKTIRQAKEICEDLNMASWENDELVVFIGNHVYDFEYSIHYSLSGQGKFYNFKDTEQIFNKLKKAGKNLVIEVYTETKVETKTVNKETSANSMTKSESIKAVEAFKYCIEDVALDTEYWFDRGINPNQDMSEKDLFDYAMNDKKIIASLIRDIESDMELEADDPAAVRELENMKTKAIERLEILEKNANQKQSANSSNVCKTETKTIEYYQNSKSDFNKFLQQCKRAISKIHGYKCDFKVEEFSMLSQIDDCRTMADELKKTGSMSMNFGETNEDGSSWLVAIHFEFENIAYAAYEEKNAIAKPSAICETTKENDMELTKKQFNALGKNLDSLIKEVKENFKDEIESCQKENYEQLIDAKIVINYFIYKLNASKGEKMRTTYEGIDGQVYEVEFSASDLVDVFGNLESLGLDPEGNFYFERVEIEPSGLIFHCSDLEFTLPI